MIGNGHAELGLERCVCDPSLVGKQVRFAIQRCLLGRYAKPWPAALSTGRRRIQSPEEVSALLDQ